MALIFLTMLVLPLASSEDARSMEKYLDCLTDKKADIVFVFDTSNSMGGEINELSAVVKDFATDLGASRIDYRLGLVEFRDFPITCGERAKISCGNPGDFAYKVKDNGTLTAEVNTFSSWLKELKAGGGGTGGPEAVLAALRHAGSDLLWRSDAEKVIIVLTDAGPHPDGDCCNAEGDTLEGTIFGLTSQGARVHVIGSEDAALRRIAGDTGGQFFKIRSGLSLKPLLKEITGAMSCSFKIEAETTCMNRTLEAKVRLVGKEVIPYLAGQTEAWMYLDQAGSKSRYNLSYDQAAGAYLASVSEVCGPVELMVYGRVGERSAVQTVQMECGTCGAAAREQGVLSISGRVFDDNNGDGIQGANEAGLEGWDVLLTKPDGSSNAAKTDRKGYYIFTGLSSGSYKVEAKAQENWTATATEGWQEVELVDVRESEFDFGFRSGQNEDLPLEMIEFNRTFGSIPEDDIESVQLTPDGGYILAGIFDYDCAWLIKTDNQGNDIWNKTICDDTRGIDIEAHSVQATPDGGYILAGEHYIPRGNMNGIKRAWLMKTDSEGNELWNKTYDGDDYANSVQLVSDNGYILAGNTYYDPDNDKAHAWLIRTDSQGNELWNKTFDGKGDDWVYEVQPTHDGGYILAGGTNSFDEGDGKAWLIKTDADGNELWNRTLGESGDGAWPCVKAQPTSDGGYIVCAGPHSLIKIDARGNEIWNRSSYILLDNGRPGSSSIHSVQPALDGGYILAIVETGDVWNDILVKTDSEGNVLWKNTIRRISDTTLIRTVLPTSDGGYIVAGGTWLIKVDVEGNIVRLPSQAG
jgi:hypothetical protein